MSGTPRPAQPADSSQFNPLAIDPEPPAASAPAPAAAPATVVTAPPAAVPTDPAPTAAPLTVTPAVTPPAAVGITTDMPAPADTDSEPPADVTADADAPGVDYARRRKRLKQAAAVVAVAACWVWFTKPWADVAAVTGTSAAAGVTVTSSQDATDLVGTDLAYAEQYLATNGTLDGIAIDGAQLAVRGTTMYAVRTVDGVCTVYGLLEGQRIPATPDPTADACKGQIVTVQATLDQAAQQTQNTASWAAEETLRKAAAAAAAYSSRNFVDGQPSMTGLPGSLSGALVMGNTGDYVTLRVSYPDACVETFVTAAGEIGETNSCS